MVLRLLGFSGFAAAAVIAWSGGTKAAETDLKLDVEGRGTITIKLYTLEAPKTTGHVMKLVKDGFYTGLRFHRVERSPKPYLVMVGDPATRKGDLDDSAAYAGGSGTTVPFENTGYQNVAGAVGLAHAGGDRNSGDSQFYILLGTAKFLNDHYTVFGQVVGGMDVVQKIERGDRVTSASIVTVPLATADLLSRGAR